MLTCQKSSSIATCIHIYQNPAPIIVYESKKLSYTTLLPAEENIYMCELLIKH